MHCKSRSLDFMSIIKGKKGHAILLGRRNKVPFSASVIEAEGRRTILSLVENYEQAKALKTWGIDKLNSPDLFTKDPYPYFTERKTISLLWEYCYHIDLLFGEVTIAPGFSVNMSDTLKSYSDHFIIWMKNMYNKANNEKIEMPKHQNYDYFAAFLNRATPNDLGYWPEEYKIS